jgi:phage baseplate assembly protein W
MALVSDSRISQRVGKKVAYADLPMAFQKHPGTGDIRPLKDIEAVKQSVKNLILTNFGDRPFNPNIGSNVTSYLFEPVSAFTVQGLRANIERTLKEQEPRINGVSVQVYDNSDENAYEIHLQYNVISLNMALQSSFFLRRLR